MTAVKGLENRLETLAFASGSICNGSENLRDNKDKRVGNFTDRESGTYAGLMLSLHDYRDRLEVHTGFKLNRKPQELDCLMIDRLDDGEDMDNDIARFF